MNKITKHTLSVISSVSVSQIYLLSIRDKLLYKIYGRLQVFSGLGINQILAVNEKIKYSYSSMSVDYICKFNSPEIRNNFRKF